jgi:integrase
VAKKLSHLRAAVNLAIDEGKLTFNPFTNVAPKADDGVIRVPLNDDDMALVRSHLHELRDEDQLLWKWLATSGMRLEEPFQVTDEHRENGVRYVIVGTKTATSKRRVPIPEIILPSVPARIEGSLFSDTPETAAKRLRYFLKRLGISHDSKRGTGDQRKVVHSLRHRAKDRLRAVRCPLDVQYELLGHEVRTVASGYGRGYPVAELKTWVDKIDF